MPNSEQYLYRYNNINTKCSFNQKSDIKLIMSIIKLTNWGKGIWGREEKQGDRKILICHNMKSTDNF